MDFSQLFKTVDTVAPGYATGIFTPTHLTILFLEILFIVLMAQKFRRLDKEKRKRALRTLALFIIINEILKDIYLLILGQFQWGNLPFHLCGVNAIVVAVHLLTGKKKAAEWLYATSLPGGLVALISPNWSKLPLLNIIYWQTNTIHTALVLYPVLLLVGGFKPKPKRFFAILPYFLILVAVIYPLNKVLDTNFFFLNYPPEGTPFVVFEELLGNPGFIVAFAALLVTVWTLLYLPWRKKGEKVVQKAA
ncbi:MAG TPA: TIGR02206 family membrane protein [Mogibacterium sp.]|nr:TIGR02206 family membrane protein [Mogibacterium sp.]